MTLDSYRSKVAFIVTPFAKAVAALHLTPNACTVLALLAAAASGIFFGLGETLIAVVLVLVSAFFDAIDGAVARLTGIASPAGDYLDHVFDRYADIFIITGIFAWGTCILGRADRLVLLMVFGAVEVVFPSPLFLGLPALGWLLVIFGVFGHVTAVQRFVSGWRELNAPRKE